jgi:NADH:ubiquinone oxidoreductase subunit H
MGLKFILLIGLLIVVRGGIPRYRYDFLTKLGWIKTLSLALVIFIINLLLSYL